jgi:TonB family protein
MKLLLISASAGILLATACERPVGTDVVPNAATGVTASSAPPAVLEVTGDVIAPRIIGTPQFQFPASPPRRRGSFELQLVISETGSVLEAHVSRSTVDPRLEPAILQSALQWRFEPATLHGRPVSVRHQTSLTLEDRLPAGSP